MLVQLKSCMTVNFKFYWRNRLLLILALIMLFITLISSIPSMLVTTSSDKFTVVQSLFESLGWFSYFLIAALGVITISHHLRNRNLKMVITKPCPIEIWLLANVGSSLLVAIGLYAGVLLVASVLFLAWHIPFQWGLLYLSA